MYKVSIFLAIFAMANAGLIGAPAVSHVSYASPVVSYGAPAITTQQENTYRSPGNLQQISTFSKTIDTPFSSVSKSDVRVSNPGLAVATAPIAYHAPAIHAVPAVPVVAKTIATPAVGLLGTTYSAAPLVSHMTYSNGVGLLYSY